MRNVLLALGLAVMGTSAGRADDYKVDASHAAVTFKISHLGLSWSHGRFKDIGGEFSADPSDPAKAGFKIAIKVDSLDTDNKQRDDHLRSPDFLNAKQFPLITFQSTAVKAVENGYEVTGDFTLHGTTKPITFKLLGGRVAEFPKGIQRTGFSTELSIRRSEFGIERFREMIGDEVFIAISFEGTKK
jgi:polyisoprenoid-binding protein YceI